MTLENDMSEIKTSIERITPEAAKNILKSSDGNFRALSKYTVLKYARDMKLGNWKMTGAPLVFNGDGSLLDGQHRLTAVAWSNCTMDFVVVRGVKSGDMSGHDSGVQRTVGQWLRRLNFKHYNCIAATARLVVAYDNGLWSNQSMNSHKYTREDVVSYAVNHKDVLEFAADIARKAHNVISPSLLATILHIGGSRKDPHENETCLWFSEKLSFGSGLSEADPVLLLRERLSASKSSKTSKLQPFTVRMLATLAWNKTVRGESVKVLKFATTGPAASKPISEIEIAG